MKESITFLKEFLKHPTKVGAVAPSSPGLVAAMMDWFDWQAIRNVVEFGPGTGVFTEGILRHLHADAKFFAIERSHEMAEAARARCPSAKIIEGSATDLDAICDAEGMDKIDAVVCGLPWASFPDSLQADIMERDAESDESKWTICNLRLLAGRDLARRTSVFETTEIQLSRCLA